MTGVVLVIVTLLGAAIINQLVILADGVKGVRDVLAGIRNDLFVEVKQAMADAVAATDAARRKEATRREDIAQAVRDATRQSKPH